MSRPVIFYVLLAVLVGALGGIHVPINGALGARINSALLATFTFYGVAFAIISTVMLLKWNAPAWRSLVAMPRWYLVAGVISVVVVGISTFLIPRLGAVNLFVIVVASQLSVRMVLSHFGWLESPVNPISATKILGGVLLVVGAILVVRPERATPPPSADPLGGASSSYHSPHRGGTIEDATTERSLNRDELPGGRSTEKEIPWGARYSSSVSA